jgi:hypothetical protein
MSYAPTLALIAALVASPASAIVKVSFVESAPKDTFTFTNAGACDLGPSVLSLDLSESAAGLIFDTTADGAGVEVFQPYETVAGAEVLASITPVKDGDAKIALTVTGLAPGQSVGFTIDVDDTARHSALGQIQVTDNEIAGATVAFTAGGTTSIGVFDNTSRAVLRTPACTS